MTDQPVDDRTACAAKIAELLQEHGCEIVGIPVYKPDGRGGWYLTVRVEVVKP